jgi:hypothetical protein
MSRLHPVAVAVLALAASVASADDLTGARRLLCASVQATQCQEGGDCLGEVPWNLNVPAFIEVDLDARKLSSTAASGENRSTPISHLARENGIIVLQGFEMGRAFSYVITEETGRAAFAMAREGSATVVFASCTPQPAPAAPATK